MENLIEMYAALEIYPVVVSYPTGQMPISYDSIKLRDFKYDNDFITYYTFGPYKLQHQEIARKNELLCGYNKILCFTKIDSTMYKKVHVNKRISDMDKRFVSLSQNIVAKANRKTFTNPFEKQIVDNTSNLMYYLRNVPGAMMKHDEVESLMTQLEEIKQKLLLTQNIKYVK